MIFLCSAKRIHKEKTYQNYFASYINGECEYVLKDKTRIDILTDRYAIEVDFANKWHEAIGQSLYYSIRSKREPGILLIMENEKDWRYLKRLLYVTKQYNIKVWTINYKFEINSLNK